MEKNVILEYKGCSKWNVIKAGEDQFGQAIVYLHCPTTQIRIPMILGPLPKEAEFVEDDTDILTDTELADVIV